MKIIVVYIACILIACLLLFQMLRFQDINTLHHCVILKQHCGFDNLVGGYYQVRDLTTGKITKVSVDVDDCDIYHEGDTIK